MHPPSSRSGAECPHLRGLALLTLTWAFAGCASSSALRYGEVLHGPESPRDVAALIRPPSAACREQASHFVRNPSDIFADPLPPALRKSTADMLRGLHPVAKQVLRRTGGVWFVRDMPEAAARFIPCDAGGKEGFILVDVHSGLPAATRDIDLPHLYWQRLGGVLPPLAEPTPVDGRPLGGSASRNLVETGSASRPLVDSSSPASSPTLDRGVRYVLLHEIGHALSLLAGEFQLGTEGQFEVGSWEGFLQFSWRARYGRGDDDDLHANGGLVPTGLALVDWRRIRRALDGRATWLAPGYRRPTPTTSPMCSLVEKLPHAGFVTPAAAVAPTEDYAELFAHAILADEHKLVAGATFEVTVAGCPTRLVRAPYFAPGVAAKRAYIEEQLEL